MLFEIGKSIFILSPELVHFFGLLLKISIVKKVIAFTVIIRKVQNQGLLACTVSAKPRCTILHIALITLLCSKMRSNLRKNIFDVIFSNP